MISKGKTGYVVLLLVMTGCFVLAVKFSLICLAQVRELQTQGHTVEAEVVRVEITEDNIYKPIFRFRLIDGIYDGGKKE